MSENTTDSNESGGNIQPNPDQPTRQASPAEGSDVDWKAKAREWEKRARGDAKRAEEAAAQLDQIRQQSMTEAEKAIAKARKEAADEARAAALTEVGQELVAAELRAVLKGRHDDPDTVIEGMNLGRFVKDGRPDRAAIKAWADKAHPERAAGFPDLGQGRRESAPANDMNSLIRRHARRG